MCLAEALLRIPDSHTAEKLIRDKLSKGQWDEHLGHSSSSLVNASTWGLMLTGKIIQLGRETRRDVGSYFRNLAGRLGEPVIRLAVTEAMGIMGQQFVLGETIESAIQRSEQGKSERYLYSFDMLGEAALTEEDATRFFRVLQPRHRGHRKPIEPRGHFRKTFRTAPSLHAQPAGKGHPRAGATPAGIGSPR